MADPNQPIARRIVELYGLPSEQAAAVVREVVDAFDLTVDDFITSRHDALKREGLSNDAIYSRILDELRAVRFRAPELTERQIRRRIYG